MSWQPLSETDIWHLVNEAFDRMTLPQRRFWEMIRIPPEKWDQHPYGDKGGGFWAMGTVGNKVIWYNDIERGFNCSQYSRHGEIDEYWCNQDELEWTVERLRYEAETGEPTGFRFSPPQPGRYPGDPR